MRTHHSSRQVVVAFSLIVCTSGCVRHGWPTLTAGDRWSVSTSEQGRRSARVTQGQSAAFPASLEDERTGVAIAPSTVRELEKPSRVGFVGGGLLLGLVSGILVGGGLTLWAQSRDGVGPNFSPLNGLLWGQGAAGALVGLVAGGMLGALLGAPVRYVVPEGSEPAQSLSPRLAE